MPRWLVVRTLLDCFDEAAVAEPRAPLFAYCYRMLGGANDASGVGGRSTGAAETMRCARSAGLSQIQPQRMACENAARNTVCVLASVPEASGRPPTPPSRRGAA